MTGSFETAPPIRRRRRRRRRRGHGLRSLFALVAYPSLPRILYDVIFDNDLKTFSMASDKVFIKTSGSLTLSTECGPCS